MPPNAPTLFKSRKEGRGSTVSFESLIIVLVDILLPENQQVAYNFKFYHILVVCLLSAGSTVVVTHFNVECVRVSLVLFRTFSLMLLLVRVSSPFDLRCIF